MNKIIFSLICTLLYSSFAFAQQNVAADSSIMLSEITITAFEQNSPVSNGTIVKVISSNNADRYNKTSLVNSFNSIAGVRMEERSPGSYRINLRGSSLRSPFGVRNVKTYWNDIPITDAGGNTYFNQFAFNNFAFLEIIKGPAGSLYGAGTGGAILMHSFNNAWKPGASIEYITGSFGLQNILTSVSFGNKNSRSLLTYAHNQSDGYRNHSSSKKDNVSFVTRHKISDKQQITTSLLYNNLFYETPGGLNKQEFESNPKLSRPAVGSFPSAEAAKAAIHQQNFTAGFSNQYNFTSGFKNTTTFYGNFNQIKNPTFRNYERRNEPGFGGRSSFVYEKEINKTKLQLVAGAEMQYGFFNTQVSKNKNGRPDTLQTNDDVKYATSSFFAQANLEFTNGWVITTGLSLNKSKVNFTRLNRYPVLEQGRSYKNELSPRLALQKKIEKNAAVFASVSKGFSPPTISELLPSTGVISTGLEAEQGVNYEFGGRVALLNNKLRLDATAFYFKLNDALVSRRDSSNADFFVNAGNTKQRGVELSADYSLTYNKSFFRTIQFNAAYTYNHFKYGAFKKGSIDFSGKNLPGVPEHTVSILADLAFVKNIYLNSTYLYTSKIFLDDANANSADKYHLLGGRIGWKSIIKTKAVLNFYAGVDNLLNEMYSLGSDINAAGGRYYNAAAARNYYVGLNVQLNSKDKK
jgi:iron complex outermembrane receptor protein